MKKYISIYDFIISYKDIIILLFSMCGIFALLNQISSNPISYDQINSEFMRGTSRGPEFSILENVSIDLKFGFHRLAINGLNKESNQPIKYNNITLICNGEIYNYKELYKSLKITPTTNSDCEVIIHCYLQFGIEYTLQMLDGVFSFALLDNDPENTKLFIARDPYGVRPLYILENTKKTDIMCFASEMKMMYKFIDIFNNNNTDNNYVINYFKPGTYSCLYYPNKILSKWEYNFKNKIYFKQGFSTNSTFSKKNLNNIFMDINYYFTDAVHKRCSNTDRPVACLLSGGLDSSLVCALVCKYFRKIHPNKIIETFSIGIKGSEDLKYSKQVANFLNTQHTNIELTKEQFIAAIPEVICAIESYDTTTIRASIGNYLVSKYIKENSTAKVIFNGDGSDELFGGYLYFNHAYNSIQFDNECRRLLDNIYMFDVLRSDKSISSNGLEPRTPFLDRQFTQYILSLSPTIRHKGGLLMDDSYSFRYMEKFLLRQAFNDEDNPILPYDVLWRTKEAFSDGVTNKRESISEIVEEHLVNFDFSEIDNNIYTHNPPITKEQKYYRYLFEKFFKGQGHILPYFWMPRFIDATDPSARTLDVYKEQHYDLMERSL